MREAWQELVRRYADGRKPCNCGCAYYTERDGSLFCEYGCSANQLSAREEIARRVLAELPERAG